IVPLVRRRDGERISIAEGACNASIDIDPGALPDGLGDAGDTPVDAHFRSENASLCGPDELAPGCLVLRGEVAQCSYPGGFYRYAVRVGPDLHLVDDPRRFPLGAAIGIALPVAALHLYKRSASTGGTPS